MTDDVAAGGSVPIASFRLAERFLDELLTRVRSSPRFPDTVEQRFDVPAVGLVPTVGAVAADLGFRLDFTRIHLRATDRNRIRVEVHMDGRITWHLALGTVTQTLDLRYDVLVRPGAVLMDGGDLELLADFSRAAVDNVRVTIRETPYLPAGVTQDLLGPLGRRFLDGFSREAVRLFMRRLGARSAVLEGPVASWLAALGVEFAPAEITVGDGWVDVTYPARDQSLRDLAIARELERRFDGASIGVTIRAGRVHRLLDLWAREYEAAGESAFRESRFTLDDGRVIVESTATLALPRPLPRPDSRVTLVLHPAVDDGVAHFDPEVQDLALPAGLRLFTGALRRWINRGLGRRLRFEVVWELPVPFDVGRWWQLSLEDIDVAADAVRVRLIGWFPTADADAEDPPPAAAYDP